MQWACFIVFIFPKHKLFDGTSVIHFRAAFKRKAALQSTTQWTACIDCHGYQVTLHPLKLVWFDPLFLIRESLAKLTVYQYWAPHDLPRRFQSIPHLNWVVPWRNYSESKNRIPVKVKKYVPGRGAVKMPVAKLKACPTFSRSSSNGIPWSVWSKLLFFFKIRGLQRPPPLPDGIY